MRMKKRTGLVMAVLAAVALSGCATPLGQRYGTIGGLTGAVIGGVVNGSKGAIIAGAAGAAAGGLIGDQQQFEMERKRGGRHVRPCTPVADPVYDRHGRVIDYRAVCR